MMEKEKLRKADIFSGSIIGLFGLWIITQALKMPMKDSWGGVQNVWYVSPAIFPLFIGAMIMLLGGLLVRTGLKEAGFESLKIIFKWLGSHDFFIFLKSPSNIRFYAITIIFLCFVFMNIPRIDFFLCSILFLVVFISMFYLDDDILIKKMLGFYLAGSAVFLLYFITGLPAVLEPSLVYPSDWLTIAFIISYIIFARKLAGKKPELIKKFKKSLVLAMSVPFIICPVFKYFLLVPMPTEGLVVSIMDYIRYFEF